MDVVTTPIAQADDSDADERTPALSSKTPEAFYREITARDDVRQILIELADRPAHE